MFNPLMYIDFYKADHRSQYPVGTELVYSNFTPRKSRIDGVDKIVFFGLQYLIKEFLIDRFNEGFFKRSKKEVVSEYRELMDSCLGKDAIDCKHIEDLWDLGYLPIVIKAVDEGSLVPIQCPMMTFYNTNARFFWLTNYLETLMSAVMWKACTSATMAHLFRREFDKYCEFTGGNKEFVDFQGHDFSFRGMSGIEDGCLSGAGHLLSFSGTDTTPSIPWLNKYYDASGFIGGSVFATEHSVLCADDEFDIYKRLLTEVYPNGIVSVVSDTYDFWKVVTEYLPRLKEDILRRDGKLVIRPDSGVPHKIICGDPDSVVECEKKGLVRCLMDTFGYTVNDLGFAELNPKVGCIYGDSIDLAEQRRIMDGLYKLRLVSTNVVLGIGSYTYQYVTRDTFGFVCKATYCEVNGQGRAIYKEPKTGAWKKSHKGLLRVNDDWSVSQDVGWSDESGGKLTEVFKNGKLMKETSLTKVRNLLKEGL